jgi:ribosomal protein S12 methylthiotransferase accessory factor
MGNQTLLADTLARCLAPDFLKRLGITRVGDLTGLDTIGLPVWFAVQPNARSLAVNQGKGLTHDQARISAVMEAAESAVAERPERLIDHYSSLDELIAAGEQAVPLDRMTGCLFDAFDAERERAWVAGKSWKTGSRVFAPYELIGLDMRVDAPWDRDAFRISSIGLGAAFDFERAALHALLEVVENDGIAPIEAFDTIEGIARPLRHETNLHAGLDEAVGKCTAAGFEPIFFDLTGRVPLPVIGCFIPRDVAGDKGPGTRYSAGFACRFDAHDAGLAALLEAVQSRLTHISGARDDIDLPDYAPFAQTISPPPADAPSISDFAAMLDLRPAPTFDTAAELLCQSGTEDIFVFPLSGDAEGVHVVKVLVPGLMAVFDDGLVTADVEMIARLTEG